ncbi:Vitamin B12-binding protein [Austwickia sp. TVS 96-490-7B]|nr:Vitamin B12-binding protein [Austwickia sp. TVS 96-490-7B]
MTTNKRQAGTVQSLSRLTLTRQLGMMSTVVVCLAGCGAADSSTPRQIGPAAPTPTGITSATTVGDRVTVTNCGQSVSYRAPVTRLFANDGNIISLVLAAGAREQLIAVTNLARDEPVLRAKYGEKLDGLNVVNGKYPTQENILAAKPQVVFAGWNYGFSEAKNLTPDTLKGHGIDSYLLSESCRPGGDSKRGTMNAWDAVETDISNIAALTGHAEEAEKVIADMRSRRERLGKAPQATRRPTVFLFDSGKDTIFSSGAFGGPQAVIDSAGGRNALEDVRDTWSKVSWERIRTADPEVIAFVEYPGQTYQEKVDILRSHPASKDLRAVREGRFVNLPYTMWTSSSLNIDAAESLRVALEKYGVVPSAGITPALDISKLSGLPGNDWQTR